jgi:hypothetical protein
MIKLINFILFKEVLAKTQGAQLFYNKINYN